MLRLPDVPDKAVKTKKHEDPFRELEAWTT